MFNNKKVLKLETEISKLTREINTINNLKIDVDKLHKASDKDLVIIYKYFDLASPVRTIITRELSDRLKLRELCNDEPKKTFGTLKQNEYFIVVRNNESTTNTKSYWVIRTKDEVLHNKNFTKLYL